MLRKRCDLSPQRSVAGKDQACWKNRSGLEFLRFVVLSLLIARRTPNFR